MARIRWVTPSWMVASLAIGVLFALGHDLFYQSLHGKAATDSAFTLAGSEVPQQQFNLAVGTALAFLVKASLVSAVSLAYLQAVWRAARSSSRPITLGNMDVFMWALVDALALVNFSTWLRWPLLFLIAVIAWLLPLASIITPATLSIGMSSPPPQLLDVPNVAFTGLSLVAAMRTNLMGGLASTCLTPEGQPDLLWCTQTTSYTYNGPSDALRRVTSATAAQGIILPVIAPAANSSWTLKFPGPFMKCSNIEGQARSLLEENIANFTLANCDAAPGYLAWTPPVALKDDDDTGSVLPFRMGLNGSYAVNTAPPTSRKKGYTATLLMAAMPQVMQFIGNGEGIMTRAACDIAKGNGTDEEKRSRVLGLNSTLLRCDLFNSTYQTDFKFVNGIQHVDVQVTDVKDKPVSTLDEVRALLREGIKLEPCDVLNAAGTTCTFDESMLRVLSYQAVMDALTELLVGQVSAVQDPDTSAYMFESNTSIASTVLTETEELGFLADHVKLASVNWPTLQNLVVSWDDSLYNGLATAPPRMNISLKDTLENLFQNLTISLMSSPALQPNKSSAFFPPKTEVTFSTLNPIFIYARQRLWIAYGVAVSCSTLTVLIGLSMIFLNGASFSESFSSLFRISKGAQLSVGIEKEDLDGRDPLPGYLKTAVVVFPTAGQQAEKRRLYEAVPEETELEILGRDAPYSEFRKTLQSSDR